MAQNYVFSVKKVRYGTATDLATMPVSLTDLPDTVKGSVTLDETEGATAKFYVDQKPVPVKVVKTEEGELSATMQFYDLTYATVAALKGGEGSASGYTSPVGYTNVEKAIQIETDSGHTVNIHKGLCVARITGGGGRDKMFALELKVTPQTPATDSGAAWTIKPV